MSDDLTNWLEDEVAARGWILKNRSRHVCRWPKEGGIGGDLWRCGKCRRLWRVSRLSDPYHHPRFKRAHWWDRIRYIGHGVA